MFPYFWLNDPLFMRRWAGPRDHTPHKSSKAVVGKKRVKTRKANKAASKQRKSNNK